MKQTPGYFLRYGIAVTAFVAAVVACSKSQNTGTGAGVVPTPTSPTPPTTPPGIAIQAACENWPTPSANDPPPIGVSLEEIADRGQESTRSLMFVDAVKSACNFGPPTQIPLCQGHDTLATTDSIGWPTQDFGVKIFNNVPNVSGTYTMSFTGKATVAAVEPLLVAVAASNPGQSVSYSNPETYKASGNTVSTCAHITNISYNSNANTTTGNIVLDSGCVDMYLTFTGTSGGVKNLQIFRPGYPLTSTEVFNQHFLDRIQPYQVLRLMEYLETNTSAVTSWSSRTPITAPIQGRTTGAAIEYAIMLANQTNKDLWINIPEQATDTDYVLSLAQLLFNTLNANRAIYLEFSNEVWNTGFAQSSQNISAAAAEVAANPNSPINLSPWSDSNPNAQTNGAKSPAGIPEQAALRIPERLMQITTVFLNTFGADCFNKKIRPVLASDLSYPQLAIQQLKYIEKNFGAPSNYLYGVAATSYINAAVTGIVTGSGSSAVTTASSSALIGAETGTVQNAPNDLDANTTWNGEYSAQPIPNFNSIAKYYGIKSIAYEGSPAISFSIPSSGSSGSVNISGLITANLSTQMGSLFQEYVSTWFGCGNDLYMAYELAHHYTYVGATYGLTDDISIDAPKNQAMEQIVSQPRSSYTTCH